MVLNQKLKIKIIKVQEVIKWNNFLIIRVPKKMVDFLGWILGIGTIIIILIQIVRKMRIMHMATMEIAEEINKIQMNHSTLIVQTIAHTITVSSQKIQTVQVLIITTHYTILNKLIIYVVKVILNKCLTWTQIIISKIVWIKILNKNKSKFGWRVPILLAMPVIIWSWDIKHRIFWQRNQISFKNDFMLYIQQNVDNKI